MDSSNSSKFVAFAIILAFLLLFAGTLQTNEGAKDAGKPAAQPVQDAQSPLGGLVDALAHPAATVMPAAQPATSPVPIGNISHVQAQKDASVEAIIDSSQMMGNGNLLVKFRHNSAKEEPVSINGHVKYALDKRTAKPGEAITLTVYSWATEYFEIKIGKASSIVGFGRKAESLDNDGLVLKELAKQGINKDDVVLEKDYSPRSRGGSPFSKIYRDTKSRKSVLVASSLPMVDDAGLPIDVGWELKGNTYAEKNNLFKATVNGNSVELVVKSDQTDGRKKNDRLSFNVQLFLNGVEQTATGPVLLEIDPINPNYLQNTLEWDFGIAKRRLRLIEGMVLGSWVFPANPNGEVRIVYNQQGDYRLKLGQFANGANEEFVPVSVFNSVSYPLTVSDSATYNPDASPETTSVDGYAWQSYAITNGVLWNTIQADAGSGASDDDTDATVIYFVADSVTDKWMGLRRGIFLFDTSALPDDASISAATLSLYGVSKADSLSATPDVNIYASAPASNTAVAAGDFDSLGITAFSTTKTYASWSTIAYNDFALNANGLAAISKTAVSKFGTRNENYDISILSPTWGSTGSSYLTAYFSEQGAGYKPKLVVTYIGPALPPLDFSAPSETNNTWLNRNYTFVNISTNNTDSDYIFLEWNGTNVTIDSPQLLLSMSFADAYYNKSSKNITDMSRYGNNGTYGGEHFNNGTLGGAAWASGKYGGALSFDGADDSVNAGNTASLKVANKMTIEAWINAAGAGEGGFGRIIDRANAYNLRVQSGGAGIQFEGAVFQATDADAITTSSVTLNEWHHVAMVYNEDGDMRIKIYLDGVQASLSTDTAGSGAFDDDSASTTFIGNNGAAGSRTFNGIIDELRIYNYTLTGLEINTSMNSHYPVNRTSASYKFEEGSGNTAYDTHHQVAGKFGGAMSFDGVDDNVQIPDSSSLDITNELTIEAWVYPNAFTAASYDTIVHKRLSADTNQQSSYSLATNWNTNNIRLFMSNATNYGISECSSNTALSIGKWQHVAVTYTGIDNITRYYLNGASDSGACTANRGATIASSDDLYIGNRNGNFFWNGTIDEVKVWSKNLSAEEISASYKAELGKYNTTQFYANMTDLADGQYRYVMVVNNTVGKLNRSQERIVNVDVACTPPGAAHWNISKECVFSGRSVSTSYNLTLMNGGNLTLINSNITFIGANQTIIVNNRSSLIIGANSRIGK